MRPEHPACVGAEKELFLSVPPLGTQRHSLVRHPVTPVPSPISDFSSRALNDPGSPAGCPCTPRPWVRVGGEESHFGVKNQAANDRRAWKAGARGRAGGGSARQARGLPWTATALLRTERGAASRRASQLSLPVPYAVLPERPVVLVSGAELSGDVCDCPCASD